MSSDSSRSVALVTGAFTKSGHAIALCLAKNFDVVINGPPEALVPLEALKAQIESQGGKSVIVAGDPTIESFWTIDEPTLKEQLGSRLLITEIVSDCPGWEKKRSQATAKAFESLYRPYKSAAEQCSKLPGAEFVGVFTRIGNESRYTLNLVIADEEGSAGTSLPGATDPLKFAIRGVTEVAGASCSVWVILDSSQS
ncbi:hypothetical protein C0992_005908 [Termitomyces sp. T32_za158]|nr:hypothetical protein C0992_005908 [Termitomyces sp. T32_za158]